MKLSDIHFSYNTNVAIDNISLTISQGDFVAVVGPNGAGKSMMIKIIAGLIKVNKGTSSNWWRRYIYSKGTRVNWLCAPELWKKYPRISCNGKRGCCFRPNFGNCCCEKNIRLSVILRIT